MKEGAAVEWDFKKAFEGWDGIFEKVLKKAEEGEAKNNKKPFSRGSSSQTPKKVVVPAVKKEEDVPIAAAASAFLLLPPLIYLKLATFLTLPNKRHIIHCFQCPVRSRKSHKMQKRSQGMSRHSRRSLRDLLRPRRVATKLGLARLVRVELRLGQSLCSCAPG